MEPFPRARIVWLLRYESEDYAMRPLDKDGIVGAYPDPLAAQHQARFFALQRNRILTVSQRLDIRRFGGLLETPSVAGARGEAVIWWNHQNGDSSVIISYHTGSLDDSSTALQAFWKIRGDGCTQQVLVALYVCSRPLMMQNALDYVSMSCHVCVHPAAVHVF